MRAIVVAAVLAIAGSSGGQAQVAPALPFGIGERLSYRVTVGSLGTVGHAVMSVEGPVDVRGTATYLLRSDIRARIGFVTVVDRAESWLDPERMAALRYRKRERRAFLRVDDQVELFPSEQRWTAGQGTAGESPTDAPLDELSFIYFVRTLELTSDSVYRLVRHYDRHRNPIAVSVIGRDTLRTEAGTFPTIIVEMRVRDPRRYGGEGTIRLHVSDDTLRLPVRIESAVPILGRTVLTLDAYTRPAAYLAHRPD